MWQRITNSRFSTSAMRRDDALSSHVVFSGGVTGGHLFPGLAVAEALRQRWPTVEITFCTRGDDWERRHIEQAGFQLQPLDLGASPKYWIARLSHTWRMWRAFRQACAWMHQRDVALAVGLGGYASLPAGLAAAVSNVPLVLLEPNAKAGRANRLLAPAAEVVCAAFAESYVDLRAASRFVLTGTPQRFKATAGASQASVERKKTLLVLGGSLGSAELNTLVPQSLARVRKWLADWQIVHQAGHNLSSAVREQYHTFDMPVDVVDFIDNLLQRLPSAELVITRGGGATLAELAAAGVPSIVCPWRKAVDDHQWTNAQCLERSGAVRLIDCGKPAHRVIDELAVEVRQLVENPQLRRRLSASIAQWARPHAAEHVVHCLMPWLPKLSHVEAAPRRQAA